MTQLKSDLLLSEDTVISSSSIFRRSCLFGILLPVSILVFLLLACGCTTTPVIPGELGSAGVTILVDDPSALPIVQEIGREYGNKTGVSVSVKLVNERKSFSL